MPRLPACLALLLVLGCRAAPPAEPAAAGEPSVALLASPDVRVIALELQPQAGALHLAGLLALPRPLLPAEGAARVVGLDGRGEALFERTVELDVRPGPAFRGGPRTASLRAELPAPAGLQAVRVIVPGR